MPTPVWCLSLMTTTVMWSLLTWWWPLQWSQYDAARLMLVDDLIGALEFVDDLDGPLHLNELMMVPWGPWWCGGAHDGDDSDDCLMMALGPWCWHALLEPWWVAWWVSAMMEMTYIDDDMIHSCEEMTYIDVMLWWAYLSLMSFGHDDIHWCDALISLLEPWWVSAMSYLLMRILYPFLNPSSPLHTPKPFLYPSAIPYSILNPSLYITLALTPCFFLMLTLTLSLNLASP